MRHLNSVTLLCPPLPRDTIPSWRRYLLHGVTLEEKTSADGTSAVMYIFPKDVKVYRSGALCKLPKISVGCVISPEVDVTNTEDVVDAVTDQGCLVVQSVKEYHRHGLCHIKVILG